MVTWSVAHLMCRPPVTLKGCHFRIVGNAEAIDEMTLQFMCNFA